MRSLFKRTTLSDRQERAVQKTLKHLQAQRRTRFRILACVDGSDDSFITIRFAARLAPNDDCDIIVLFVRPVDQGLWSGGLQLRLARQNMMDAGFELPGVRDLKKALEILKEEGIDAESWPREASQQDAWGDPAGDTKVEYRSPEGRTVVLKLKTAPDAANGILDQYELGPYNLMILGEPSRWRGEFQAWFDAGVVQQVTLMAPCSVLVARKSLDKSGFFICTDGTSRSMQAVRRAAVLAYTAREPITLFLGRNDRGRAAGCRGSGRQCPRPPEGDEDRCRRHANRSRQARRRDHRGEPDAPDGGGDRRRPFTDAAHFPRVDGDRSRARGTNQRARRTVAAASRHLAHNSEDA